MNDISRIRAIATAGTANTNNPAQIQRESRAAQNLGQDHPGGIFRSMSLTMHRAVKEGRAVCPREVSTLLRLFERFWKSVEANDDSPLVEPATLARLTKVTPARSVGDAYKQLHDDMLQLSQPPTKLSSSGRKARAELEERYALTVGAHSVVCCAGAASAVADAIDILFEALGARPQYRELFPNEFLRPCVPLLLTQRPTWTELLRDHAKTVPAA